MPAEFILQTRRAIRYDGTNGAEILALCPDLPGMESGTFPAQILSQVSGVITIGYADSSTGGYSFTLNPGDWAELTWQPNALVLADDFAKLFVRVSDLKNPE